MQRASLHLEVGLGSCKAPPARLRTKARSEGAGPERAQRGLRELSARAALGVARGSECRRGRYSWPLAGPAQPTDPEWRTRAPPGSLASFQAGRPGLSRMAERRLPGRAGPTGEWARRCRVGPCPPRPCACQAPPRSPGSAPSAPMLLQGT